jgi:cbb3-type cytochrome oxidase maturation protein
MKTVFASEIRPAGRTVMDILYFLIPITLFVILVAACAFIWAVKTGQFDDLEGPAYRILMDDDDPRIPRPPGREDSNGSQARDP